VTGFVPGPYDEEVKAQFPRQPVVIDSMAEARRMFDGYDTGVLYADQHIGQILNALADQNVLDETAIIVSADHGENLGELNIYGDHQTADHCTSRVPLIVSWPGVTGAPRVDTALHYHVDFAATTIELLGGKVPANWDGWSFASAMKANSEQGWHYLVLSQGAWSCQRAVRFGDYLFMRSYHDGYHAFLDGMLFNVNDDPHEQKNIAAANKSLLAAASMYLDEWHGDMMGTSTIGFDPMWTVVREGGAFHTRGQLPAYLKRLRETGREQWAEKLAAQHPSEAR
jgi:arylsulfatase A-like enzyme